MKCLVLLFLYLASLVSDVCSLGLAITVLDGYTAVVRWTREDSDPDPLSFDLRYVIPPYYDVGLAQANLSPSPIESSGNITVQFPQDGGRYMLIAVAGPNNFQIGRTAVIEVPGKASALTPLHIPTFSSTPTPTPTPSSRTSAPSQDPSSIPSPSKSFAPFASVGLQKKPNVPAIVLGILGGILLTALLIFALFYRCRRHRMEEKRISFHRDRMVQHRSSDRHNASVSRGGRLGGVIIPYPFINPDSSLGSTRRTTNTQDVEQGLAVPRPAISSLPPNLSESRPNTSLPHGYIVPPPRGPRDRTKSVRQAESARTSRANDGPTARQRQLADKLVEVEKQIEKAKSEPKPSPSTVVLLDDLKLQKAWLVKQQDSMWALEKIDTLPPGYSRYMA